MSILDAINNYLVNQKKSQRILVYVLVAVSVVFLAYLFVFMDVMSEFESKDREIKDKQNKLIKLQGESGTKQIAFLKNSVNKLREEVISIENRSIMVARESDDKRYYSINPSNLASFLKDSLARANETNINIKNVNIDSIKLPYVGMLEIQKVVKLEGIGNFLDVLNLLRYMENQKFLIRLRVLEVDNVYSADIKQAQNNNYADPRMRPEAKENKIPKGHVFFQATFEVIGVQK